MSIQIGDVFSLECEYGDVEFTEDRPVVVIDIDMEGNFVVVAVVTEITTQPPKALSRGYGKYRVPIWNWRTIGLSEPSYAKANKTARVHATDLTSVRTIGFMDPQDVEMVPKYVRQYIFDN